MKKKIVDPNMPVGKLIPVKDFLPPPEELVFPHQASKITISLDRSDIDFFKQQAKKHHTKYQKMIREVLNKYVERYRAA